MESLSNFLKELQERKPAPPEPGREPRKQDGTWPPLPNMGPGFAKAVANRYQEVSRTARDTGEEWNNLAAAAFECTKLTMEEIQHINHQVGLCQISEPMDEAFRRLDENILRGEIIPSYRFELEPRSSQISPEKSGPNHELASGAKPQTSNLPSAVPITVQAPPTAPEREPNNLISAKQVLQPQWPPHWTDKDKKMGFYAAKLMDAAPDVCMKAVKSESWDHAITYAGQVSDFAACVELLMQKDAGLSPDRERALKNLETQRIALDTIREKHKDSDRRERTGMGKVRDIAALTLAGDDLHFAAVAALKETVSLDLLRSGK